MRISSEFVWVSKGAKVKQLYGSERTSLNERRLLLYNQTYKKYQLKQRNNLRSGELCKSDGNELSKC